MNTTTCSDCENSSLPESQALVGWVLEASGRGTLSLISTCLTTIFLCTWVVIHPRVYKNGFYATSHKFTLFFKAIFAPEFIAVEGLQEWAQCRKIEKYFDEKELGPLKLIHAFYISMLALRYPTEQGGDKVIWPNQFIWLFENDIIKWKEHEDWGIAEDDIRDKSKGDSVAKLLALLQVLWFVAQCIMRGAHGLPISQLESMTLGYIPLFVVTYFFWWHKPKDIRSPTYLDILPELDLNHMRENFELMAISNKFDTEWKDDQLPYSNIWYLTPRMFEKEEEDEAIKIAQEKLNERAARKAEERASDNRQGDFKPGVRHETTIPTIEELQIEMQKETVLAYWDPKLYCSVLWLPICFFAISFPLLHLASWNTVFPTVIEMWFWRVSAFVSISSMLSFIHVKKVVLRRGSIWDFVGIASAFLYFVSRVFMLAEAFIALRAEDPAIYDTYVVSTYWVHFL